MPVLNLLPAYSSQKVKTGEHGVPAIDTEFCSGGLCWPGKGSGWRLEADTPEGGFIILTPQGSNNTWNQSDENFIPEAVEHVKTIANIDPNKESKMKKNALRLLITTLAIATLAFAGYACDGTSSSSSGGCNSSSGGYDTYNEGPYATTQDLSAGPSRNSGLFYPSTGSGPFPILVFGCGAGTNPISYVDHGNYIASWGFIVMIETSTDSGQELLDAIDWLTTQNSRATSVLYRKCNLDKIAAGGHSRGSIGTFAIASDSRLDTTIHVAGGSFTGMGAYSLRNPAAYICGEADTLATPNAETDYNRTSVPVFMTVMDGVNHIQAAREGLPAICAWLLWQLSGETQRRGDFLNAGGEFTVGKWDSKSKNW